MKSSIRINEKTSFKPNIRQPQKWSCNELSIYDYKDITSAFNYKNYLSCIVGPDYTFSVSSPNYTEDGSFTGSTPWYNSDLDLS